MLYFPARLCAKALLAHRMLWIQYIHPEKRHNRSGDFASLDSVLIARRAESTILLN